MREIKFRIRYKKKYIDCCVIIPINNLILGELKESLGIDEIISIEQFTGLKDKNGKEIYERDIVTFEINNFSYVGEIKFEAGRFIIGCNEIDDSYMNLSDLDIEDEALWQVRILGNIYENPELLEKGK